LLSTDETAPDTVGPARRIIRGAVRYSRDCAALAVAPDECCLVTDHRLLPLSWTRDAHYQAVLLLAAGPWSTACWPRATIPDQLTGHRRSVIRIAGARSSGHGSRPPATGADKTR
jgi:hypothetical protein